MVMRLGQTTSGKANQCIYRIQSGEKLGHTLPSRVPKQNKSIKYMPCGLGRLQRRPRINCFYHLLETDCREERLFLKKGRNEKQCFICAMVKFNCCLSCTWLHNPILKIIRGGGGKWLVEFFFLFVFQQRWHFLFNHFQASDVECCNGNYNTLCHFEFGGTLLMFSVLRSNFKCVLLVLSVPINFSTFKEKHTW